MITKRRRPVAALLIVIHSTVLTIPVRAQQAQAFTFTDPTLTAQSTVVKAVHITELRTAINTLRAAAGLGATTFTDPTLTAATTPIRVVHITELRTTLNTVYTAVGQTLPTYTDATLIAGSSAIKAVHITELRNAANNVTIPSGFSITSLSASSLAPSRLLTVTGTGFDATAKTFAVFTDSANRTIEVGATSVTGTTVTVPVPVFVNAAGQLTSGIVSVKVKKIGTTTATSNALSNFQIGAPPTTTAPAGALAQALLEATRAQNLVVKTENVSSATKTSIDAANDKLALLIARIQAVMDNPSATIPLGTKDGQSLTASANDLAAMDRILLSAVDALATESSGGITALDSPCVALEAEALRAASVAGGAYKQRALELTRGLRGKCELLGVGSIAAAVMSGGALAGIGGWVVLSTGAAITLPTAGGVALIIAGGYLLKLGVDMYTALSQTSANNGTKIQNQTQGITNRVDYLMQQACGTSSNDVGGAAGSCSGEIVSISNTATSLSSTFTASTLPPPAPPPTIPSINGVSLTTSGTVGTATVSPVTAGVGVTYSVVGTDGYTVSGTRTTNSAGVITYSVQSTCGGIVDTHVVTVIGGPSANTSFTWGSCALGTSSVRRMPDVP
jgi:hypothetical protein